MKYKLTRIRHKIARRNPWDMNRCEGMLVEEWLVLVCMIMIIDEFLELHQVTACYIFPTDRLFDDLAGFAHRFAFLDMIEGAHVIYVVITGCV